MPETLPPRATSSRSMTCAGGQAAIPQRDRRASRLVVNAIAHRADVYRGT
jgi:hypothetical protein